MDYVSREKALALIILNHSLKIKPKEKVLISVSNPSAFLLAKEVYIETLKLGAFPLMDESSISGISYNFYKLANDWQLNHIPKEVLLAKYNWANAYVRIFSSENSRELNQIETEKITTRSKLLRPLTDKMIDSDRWLLTEFPSLSMAQDAGVSLDWLTNFYFNSCLIDYKKMEKSLLSLEKTLDNAKEISIVSKDTNLSFSATGRLSKACFGERNIPDGEVFLAPIKNSLEGKIYFELPTEYLGTEVEGIYLEFSKGRVVKATANKNQGFLEKILDSDSGARFVGEFALGANYNIKDCLKNTLFDEKIGGTIHLALGRSYKEERGGVPTGGNESSVHWDLVKDTRIKGSMVLVNGKEILKDGKILV